MQKLFILLFILVSISCKDIIDEVRIYESSVELLAPTDAAVLNEIDVTFIWNSVDGANEYIIQIATPDFTSPTQIVTDTTITTTSFSTTLTASTNYEWRVKAKNTNYETAFNTRSLEIQ